MGTGAAPDVTSLGRVEQLLRLQTESQSPAGSAVLGAGQGALPTSGMYGVRS
jgi:hypothetical protein